MKNKNKALRSGDEKLLKTAFMMAAIIIASKAMGLLRDVLIANYYGMGIEATAYETASRLPILLFDLVIGGVVTAAFIPIFNEILVSSGTEHAFRFADSYLTAVVLLSSLIAVIGVIFAPQLVSILAPGISSETRELAITLTRIMFPMVIFTSIAFVFVGILQSMGEYTIPALISLVSNTIMVAYLFSLSQIAGIIGLAVAMLLGWTSQAVVQLPKVRSLGYRYHFRLDLKDKSLIGSLKSALPILISSWTQPICLAINTSFASGIENGRGITAIGYSNRLYTIIVGVFSFVATNLLFPKFSKAEAMGDRDESERLTRASCRLLIYIIAPIAVGIAVLSTPFIALVFERGEFTAADTALTATAMRFFTIGMPFMAINEVLVKSFFATKKEKFPMIASIAATIANTAFVSVFADRLGIAGIAIASSAAIAVNCCLNLIFARRNSISAITRAELPDIIKSLISAALMGAVTYVVYHIVFAESLIGFFAAVICGALSYLIITLIMRSDETTEIAKQLLSKLHRKPNGSQK